MIILWVLFGVVLLTVSLVALIAFRSSRRSAALRSGAALTVRATPMAAVVLEIDDADPAFPGRPAPGP